MNICPSKIKQLAKSDSLILRPVEQQAAIEYYLEQFRLLKGELLASYVTSADYSDNYAAIHCIEHLNNLKNLLKQYEDAEQYLIDSAKDSIQYCAGLALMSKIKERIKAYLPGNAQINVAPVEEVASILKNRVIRKEAIIASYLEAVEFLQSVLTS